MRWHSQFSALVPAALLALGLGLLSARDAAGQAGQVAGVHVDAENVLRLTVVQDQGGRLMQQRVQAAQASLPAEVQQRSELRKISLNRLEAAITKCIEEGREPTDEMLHLAGLQRLQYVFYYPETKDLVIAGPAEGWVPDPAGRVVGLTSGRPTLKLEDLVVALRTFGPEQRKNPMIGCSIDPTQEGLQRLQQFLGRVGRAATPAQTQFIVTGLRQSLGLQTVSIFGVPGNSHFAQVLVEADYRMKLIGIGLERPPVQMSTYVDLVNPAAVAANALQRWYFTPNYECVRVSEDRQAMELVGLGVKLVSEDELVTQDGQRVQAGQGNDASSRYAKAFTAKYEELAAKSPIYAELRNLIDMTIAAAYIQQEDFYGKAGWDMMVLGNEELFEVEKYNTPEKVESAVNSIWRGRTLMTPIGGGVEIRPRRALASDKLLADEDGKLGQTRAGIKLELAEGQWWWD